jgi:hypothetical protein
VAMITVSAKPIAVAKMIRPILVRIGILES